MRADQVRTAVVLLAALSEGPKDALELARLTRLPPAAVQQLLRDLPRYGFRLRETQADPAGKRGRPPTLYQLDRAEIGSVAPSSAPARVGVGPLARRQWT